MLKVFGKKLLELGVSPSTGFVGETSYFNARDELVAVESWSDALGSYYSGKTAQIVYGNQPACEKRTTASLKQKAGSL